MKRLGFQKKKKKKHRNEKIGDHVDQREYQTVLQTQQTGSRTNLRTQTPKF